VIGEMKIATLTILATLTNLTNLANRYSSFLIVIFSRFLKKQ
jgi:hypothetical protein